MSHIKAKIHKIRFLAFVRSTVCVLTHTAYTIRPMHVNLSPTGGHCHCVAGRSAVRLTTVTVIFPFWPQTASRGVPWFTVTCPRQVFDI